MPIFEYLTKPTPDQSAGILRLYRNEGWWGDGPDNVDLIRRLVAGSHCFLSVAETTEIIAMGRAISDGASDAYIQDVAVTPGWRGRGLGAGIVQRLVARLHQDGLFWIGLIAERDSSPFYQRIGFEPMPNAVPMLRKGD